MSAPSGDLAVREYTPDDEPAVLRLLSASMGWVPDAHHRDYFRWKHHQSPFGPSPAWVAMDGEQLAGFRTFMRWEFRRGDEVVRAVRAVDTATHPDHQGRGIFSLLTQHALRQFEAEGVAFVFNTPNSKSRPGYLKMGWVDVGAVPVRVRPATSLRSVVRLAASRTPAERWSLPTTAGVDAASILGAGSQQEGAVGALLAGVRLARSGHLSTNRTIELLRWRYSGFAPLAYRCLLRTDDPADGFVVFRLRRRGKAVEAVVNTVLLENEDASLTPMLRRLLRATGADYVLRIGNSTLDGLVRLPGQGPLLTFRHLRESEPPPLDHWDLEMGDIELF